MAHFNDGFLLLLLPRRINSTTFFCVSASLHGLCFIVSISWSLEMYPNGSHHNIFWLQPMVSLSVAQSCKNLQFTLGSRNQQNLNFVHSIARCGALSFHLWHCHSHWHCENGTHDLFSTHVTCTRRLQFATHRHPPIFCVCFSISPLSSLAAACHDEFWYAAAAVLSCFCVALVSSIPA